MVVDEERIDNINPLPNLECKIVRGNSLLGYPYEPRGLEEIEKLKDNYFSLTDKREKEREKEKIDTKIWEFYRNTPQTLGYQVDFDFQINFSEVKGFDIVIGNPPYVGQKGNSELFAKMKQDPNFEKKMDYWYFFLYKAQNITANEGITTYITPNYWITARGARILRKKITEEFRFFLTC